MNEATSTAGAHPHGSWRSRVQPIVDRYRREHTNRVNRFLHVAVGWPMVGVSPFVALADGAAGAALFLGGYAAMFTGHFVFEHNIPTIFKHPTVAVVVGWALCRSVWHYGWRGWTGFLTAEKRSGE